MKRALIALMGFMALMMLGGCASMTGENINPDQLAGLIGKPVGEVQSALGEPQSSDVRGNAGVYVWEYGKCMLEIGTDENGEINKIHRIRARWNWGTSFFWGGEIGATLLREEQEAADEYCRDMINLLGQ